MLAAIVGAYGVAWTYTALLSLLLVRAGLERSNAVAWATLSSYLVYLAVALWSVAHRSVLTLWLGFAGVAAAFALAAHLLAAR